MDRHGFAFIVSRVMAVYVLTRLLTLFMGLPTLVTSMSMMELGPGEWLANGAAILVVYVGIAVLAWLLWARADRFANVFDKASGGATMRVDLAFRRALFASVGLIYALNSAVTLVTLELSRDLSPRLASISQFIAPEFAKHIVYLVVGAALFLANLFPENRFMRGIRSSLDRTPFDEEES